jgi:2-polyprenyl-3-methyl-5-hydroxy-6-metoxy-1,4-benzoquinol methylase
VSSRWLGRDDVPRGDEYQARFDALAAQGQDVHGEVAFLLGLDPAPTSVLDAGCGTGRIAVELARRGVDVVGVDVDPRMLVTARAARPDLPWIESDLVELDLGRTFDAVVLAGNVLIFVAPDTEGTVVARAAAHLEPGGALVAGFQLGPRRYTLAALDTDAEAAGLTLAERWATWDRAAFEVGDYAVSVYRRGR